MARRLESLSVAEIRRIYVYEQRAPSASMLTRMRRDPRQGVRKVHAVLRRRVAAQRLEQKRLERLLQLERDLWDQGQGAVWRLNLARIIELGKETEYLIPISN